MHQIAQLLLKNKLLALSLIANIGLLVACLFIFSELKKFYTHYRHFRALPIGTSKATSVTAPLGDNTIVLFGDSRIETWYPDPESGRFTFVNAGVTGETTSEMKRRFERDVVRLQPEYVLIQAGMNDLTASVTKGIKEPEKLLLDMQDNLDFFITTLEQQGVDVIVTSIIPNNHLSLFRKQFWFDTLDDKVKQANIELKQTTLQAGAEWFDLDPLYLDKKGEPVQELFFDTLHINYEGYILLNSHLKEYLRQL